MVGRTAQIRLLHEAEVQAVSGSIVEQLRALNEPVIDERLNILGYPDCDGRTLYMNATGPRS